MGICILSLEHGSEQRFQCYLHIVKNLSGIFSLTSSRVRALGWPLLGFFFGIFLGCLWGKPFLWNMYNVSGLKYFLESGHYAFEEIVGSTSVTVAKVTLTVANPPQPPPSLPHPLLQTIKRNSKWERFLFSKCEHVIITLKSLTEELLALCESAIFIREWRPLQWESRGGWKMNDFPSQSIFVLLVRRGNNVYAYK